MHINHAPIGTRENQNCATFSCYSILVQNEIRSCVIKQINKTEDVK